MKQFFTLFRIIRLTLCILLISYQFRVMAQWQPILSDYVVSLSIVNADTVFAVGNNRILRSFDGGNNWENLLPFPINALSVSFLTSEIGYVSGQGIIIKTTDGGNTWFILKEDPPELISHYNKLCFPDTNLGFVISDNYNILYKTTNGGLSWETILTGKTITDIHMFDKITGYLAADSLYKTLDGGNTWMPITINTMCNIPKAISFLHPDTGIVLCDPPFISKTNDGGITWEITQLPEYPFASMTTKLRPISSNSIYFCGWDPLTNSGAIMYSNDGGLTWIEQKLGLFNDLEMANDSVGYAICINNGIYKTINGGFIVGVNEKDKGLNGNFRVYPNPVYDLLYVSSNKQYNNALICIYDTNSKLITQVYLFQEISVLPVSHFPKGIYRYSIFSETNKMQSGIFIKY